MANDYNNLYRGYQIQAAESVLDPDEPAYYRRICRWYSTKFHTPLMQVYDLPIDHVLTNYYESQLEDIKYNDLYDIVIEDFLPELVEEQDLAGEQYAKELEAEQALSLAKAQAKKLGLNKQTTPRPQSDDKQLNKQQSLKDKALSVPDEVNISFDDEKDV